VLEGAVSIAWKDRGMQTFKAGSTYFEGAGENHPPEEMAAKNVAEGVTRTLVIELLPKIIRWRQEDGIRRCLKCVDLASIADQVHSD